MKPFLKYTILAVGIQILLCIIAMMAPFGLVILLLYLPVIEIVGILGNFAGEFPVFEPMILGVPLGILIYGVIIGLVLSWLRRIKPKT